MPQINDANSGSLERNILPNLDVPISHIPDEVLAMIFKEGILPRKHGHHFAVRLSHVSRRWRNIVTTTPTLWTYLRLQEQPHDDEVEDEEESPELLKELTRARTFLSRSKLCPVDIHIEGFNKISLKFIQLIGEHIGHCRVLRTRQVGEDCLDQLLQCFSSKPIPFLSSIDLSSEHVIKLPEQLFPHGAPRLTTVQLDGVEILDMHFHLPAFSSVTCLRLTGVFITIDSSEEYSSFRDGLMALPSLHHLELQLEWFDVTPYHLPIALPTIQFLHINASKSDCRQCLGPLISILHAPSLATLSLTAWVNFSAGSVIYVDFGGELELHLPSLKHLILDDFVVWLEDDIEVFARTFPGIERLSVEMMADYHLWTMLESWPKLQTIAASVFEQNDEIPDFYSVVRESQEAGHPICRLMLRRTSLSEAVDVELRKLVVIEDYYVDWPTPFERSYFDD